MFTCHMYVYSNTTCNTVCIEYVCVFTCTYVEVCVLSNSVGFYVNLQVTVHVRRSYNNVLTVHTSLNTFCYLHEDRISSVPHYIIIDVGSGPRDKSLEWGKS